MDDKFFIEDENNENYFATNNTCFPNINCNVPGDNALELS